MNTAVEKVVAFPGGPATGSGWAPTQDELRERVRAIIDAEGLSQNQVAKEAGLKPATFSQWLSDSYPGNNEKIALAVSNWIARRAAGQELAAVMPVVPVWIDMPTARRIYGALNYAQLAGDIATVYGGAGLCKTTTIKRYREKQPNVWVVTATPATASVGVLLEEMALSMGLRDFALHPAKLQRAIVRQVADTGGLIIVDEAQHLTKNALEAARSIHDATGIGLALCGNASIYNRLYGGGNNGFAQLFSRVGKRVALSKPTAGDVVALAGAFGVSGKAELAVLEDVGRRPGALRMVTKTLRLAAVLAAGQPIARTHIEASWRDLQGDVLGGENGDA